MRLSGERSISRMGEARPRSGAHCASQQKQSCATRARTCRRQSSDLVLRFGHEKGQTAFEAVRKQLEARGSLDVAELPRFLQHAKDQQEQIWDPSLEAERGERCDQNACILPCVAQSAADKRRPEPPRAERHIQSTIRRGALAFCDFQPQSIQRALRQGSRSQSRAHFAAQHALQYRRWQAAP